MLYVADGPQPPPPPPAKTGHCHAFTVAGGSCGGYVPMGFESRCADGLECVNTMGPMIADAPGSCTAPCPTSADGRPQDRDDWGACIDPVARATARKAMLTH